MNQMPNCINPSAQFNLLKLKIEKNKNKIENYVYLFVSHYRIARLRVHPLRAVTFSTLVPTLQFRGLWEQGLCGRD